MKTEKNVRKLVKTEDDLDFEDIPDAELYPCCLWEYARESRQIRELTRLITHDDRCPPLVMDVMDSAREGEEAKAETNKLIAKAKRIQVVNSPATLNEAVEVMKDLQHQLRRLHAGYESIQQPNRELVEEINKRFSEARDSLEEASRAGTAAPDKLAGEIGKKLETLKMQASDPCRLFWKGLLNSRSRIVYLATEVQHFNPPVSFPDSWKSLTVRTRSRLAAFWPSRTSRKSVKGSKVLVPPDPIREGAFAPWLAANSSEEFPDPPIYFDVHIGQFQIKWNFIDDDITAAFRAWLKKNRPLASAPDDRRGRNPGHYRVALRRLGIMRRINSDRSKANAEDNKEARRVPQHFWEFVKPGLLDDAKLAEASGKEMPLHWPAGWK